MKSEIHPKYEYVVFRDRKGGLEFLTRSTMASDPRVTQSVEWKDGKTYPLYDVDVSSATHPFYTGKRTVLDSAGQVSKFEKRYGKRK